MENRFSFKDLFLASLVILLIIVVWLGMKQLDRQWVEIQTIKGQGNDQANKLSSIQRMLEEGISIGGPAGGSSTQPTTRASASEDTFANLKEAEKRPDFARGDWLIDNIPAKLPRVTPLISTDLYADWVQAHVLEPMIYRDPDTLEYRPQLARSWQMTPDGLTLTFQLRKGIRFSDGEPLTADDLLYTYQLIMNPKINAPRFRAYFEKVKSLEKHGDFEVVFTMKEPYFESLDLCGTLNILPKHFLSKYDDEEINQNPGLLMGTGPYKMVDPAGWRPGKKVELVRNESYWGEAGTFERIIFLEVQEEAAEETMFGNGELDVYVTQPEQYLRLLKDPKTTAHANHFEFESPMSGYAFAAWNERRKDKPTIFADVRVRRAMTMLTDRDRICQEVFRGYAKPISGPFATNSPQADPAIQPLPYDPEGAKKLLAEAGFQDKDGAGVIKGPDGQPFRFKLTYGSGNATMERVFLFMKDGFAKAGITMELNPVDWPVLMKDLDNRDFDAVSLAWAGSIESDLYQEFDSSQIKDQGDNFMSYENKEFDSLAGEARRTVDAAKRMALWRKAHAVLAADQPYTFLFSRMSLRFMDKRIQNVRKSKIGLNYIYRYSMPMPWYVPKAMQKYSR
jgi:peptide/nickel transport system substrate-binding protein